MDPSKKSKGTKVLKWRGKKNSKLCLLRSMLHNHNNGNLLLP